MVVLVTGANGQLGQSIQFIANKYPNIQFEYTDFQEMDITNIENCQAVFAKHQPHFCINTAAYTAVDKAENDVETAEKVGIAHDIAKEIPNDEKLKYVENNNIQIDEIIDENSDNSLEIIQNSLDIFPIVWQNILVDVPLRVLAPDASDEPASGDGWRLITEDTNEEVIDPRLAKLKDYIKE